MPLWAICVLIVLVVMSTLATHAAAREVREAVYQLRLIEQHLRRLK